MSVFIFILQLNVTDVVGPSLIDSRHIVVCSFIQLLQQNSQHLFDVIVTIVITRLPAVHQTTTNNKVK